MPPIGSIDGPSGVRRTRRKRRGDRAGETGPIEEPQAASAAGAVPPRPSGHAEVPPIISAQAIGESDSAENAAPANSAALEARTAYLKVQWSGPYDRRMARGRITKTDV